MTEVAKESYLAFDQLKTIRLPVENVYFLTKGTAGFVYFELDHVNEEYITLSAYDNGGDRAAIHIAVELFIELISKGASVDDPIPLEELSVFKNLVRGALDNYISIKKRKGQHVLPVDEITTLGDGMGIVTDTRTGYQIATFEQISFEPFITASIDAHAIFPIAQSSFFASIDQKADHLEFSYYSLSEKAVYTLSKPLRMKHNESDYVFEDHIEMNSPNITVQPFDESHGWWSIIEEAARTKLLQESPEMTDFISETIYEEFRQKRLQIIEKSKKAIKKESIYNKFASIDLDF